MKKLFVCLILLILTGCVTKTVDPRGIHGAILYNTKTGDSYLAEKAGEKTYNMHTVDKKTGSVTYVK